MWILLSRSKHSCYADVVAQMKDEYEKAKGFGDVLGSLETEFKTSGKLVGNSDVTFDVVSNVEDAELFEDAISEWLVGKGFKQTRQYGTTVYRKDGCYPFFADRFEKTGKGFKFLISRPAIY